MKKAFFLLCALLLAGSCLLPQAGYRLAQTVLHPQPSADLASSAEGTPEPQAASASAPSSAAVDAEVFLVQDSATGSVLELSRRDYLIGAVAAEMPVTWPDEALKAQAVAAHSYILYCRDHAAAPETGWLTADPARRQGVLTDPVLHSYWGVDYDANYARLSALVDQVLTAVVCYQDAPAGTSYFALSNGLTEASENVWGTPLPYLVPVESSSDLAADNYQYTLTLTAAQVQSLLSAGLGVAPDASAPEQWFGTPRFTPSGYVASLSVCGQTVTGPTLRRVLGLRSACFSIRYADGSFAFTTRGYGHGVGLSQWGAKAMAEAGKSWQEILTHYFPDTEIWE